MEKIFWTIAFGASASLLALLGAREESEVELRKSRPLSNLKLELQLMEMEKLKLLFQRLMPAFFKVNFGTPQKS